MNNILTISKTKSQTVNKKLIFGFLFMIIPFILVWSVCEHIVPIQGDDVLYQSFTKSGLKNFFQFNIWHYNHYTGRAFVHLCLQFVLIFKEHLYSFLIPFFISFSSFILCDSLSENKSKKNECLKENKTDLLCQKFITSGMVLFLFISLPRQYFIVSTIWMSAGFNYIFPFFFILLFSYILKNKLNSWHGYFFAYLFAFLSGATTELYGLFTIGLISLITFFDILDKNQKILKKRIIPLFLSIIGYLSVVFSPATNNRVETEISMSLKNFLLPFFGKEKYLFGDVKSCLPLFLVFVLFAIGFLQYSPKPERNIFHSNFLSISGFILAVVTLLLNIFGINFVQGFILFLYLVFVCLFFFKNKRTRFLGSVLVCGYGTFFTITALNKGCTNTSMPLILSLFSVIAVILAYGILNSDKKKWIIRIFSFLFCIYSLFPFADVYFGTKNTEKYMKPLYENFKELQSTGETTIQFENLADLPGYYRYQTVFEVLDKPDADHFEQHIGFNKNFKIHWKSEKYKVFDMYINGKLYYAPVVEQSGKLYVPFNDNSYKNVDYCKIGDGALQIFNKFIFIDDFCKIRDYSFKLENNEYYFVSR